MKRCREDVRSDTTSVKKTVLGEKLPIDLRNLVCEYLPAAEIYHLQQHVWQDLSWDDEKLLEHVRCCLRTELKYVDWKRRLESEKPFVTMERAQSEPITLAEFYAGAHESQAWLAGGCLARVAHGLPLTQEHTDWDLFVSNAQADLLEKRITWYYEDYFAAERYGHDIGNEIKWVRNYTSGDYKLQVVQVNDEMLQVRSMWDWIQYAFDFDVCKIACFFHPDGPSKILCTNPLALWTRTCNFQYTKSASSSLQRVVKMKNLGFVFVWSCEIWKRLLSENQYLPFLPSSLQFILVDTELPRNEPLVRRFLSKDEEVYSILETDLQLDCNNYPTCPFALTTAEFWKPHLHIRCTKVILVLPK